MKLASLLRLGARMRKDDNEAAGQDAERPEAPSMGPGDDGPNLREKDLETLRELRLELMELRRQIRSAISESTNTDLP